MALTGLIGYFEAAFAILACLIVLRFLLVNLWDLTENVYAFWCGECLGRTVNYRKMGEWAVVTGATDGIGKAFAKDLARRGCNIVLISRSEERLQNVAREIETAHSVRTKTIAVDFGSDESIYDKLREELTKLEVGTLVNNVGIIYAYPECFHQVPGGEEFFLKMIRINCVAQTLCFNADLKKITLLKKNKNKNSSPTHTFAKNNKLNSDENTLNAAPTSWCTGSNYLLGKPERKDQSIVIQSIPGDKNWFRHNIPASLNSFVSRFVLIQWRNDIVSKIKKEGTYVG